MYIKIGEKTYNLTFRYGNVQTKRGVRSYTDCLLNNEDGTNIMSGRSVCAPGDNFRRAEGRKIALTKAIRGFKRDFRKALWTEYLKRCSI